LLAAYGIEVLLFNKPMPTPVLCFTVRHCGCGWGIVLTASHNPQEYNGYKIYDHLGIQLTNHMSDTVAKEIERVAYFSPYPQENGKISVVTSMIVDAYTTHVIDVVGKRDGEAISLVYSALHGTGANVIPGVLQKLDFDPLFIQQTPDGFFGGLKTPNPEESAVYAQAIEKARLVGANLLCATDPDADRVGVMIRQQEEFLPLDGNQIGALIIDYLAKTRGVSPGDTVITTIVSGGLGESVAAAHGLDFERLLTGFKYIGERAEKLTLENKKFFFGYEESYGYLTGDGVRDKDAVIAVALIANMASFYYERGRTLLDIWQELSAQHGYFLEALDSTFLPSDKQLAIMSHFRNGYAVKGLVKLEDYANGINNLPPSNVIKLYFKDGWAALRPSGTEPKIKLYTGIRSDTYEQAKRRLAELRKQLLSLLGD
jgi:phosphoglucomutase